MSTAYLLLENNYYAGSIGQQPGYGDITETVNGVKLTYAMFDYNQNYGQREPLIQLWSGVDLKRWEEKAFNDAGISPGQFFPNIITAHRYGGELRTAYKNGGFVFDPDGPNYTLQAKGSMYYNYTPIMQQQKFIGLYNEIPDFAYEAKTVSAMGYTYVYAKYLMLQVNVDVINLSLSKSSLIEGERAAITISSEKVYAHDIEVSASFIDPQAASQAALLGNGKFILPAWQTSVTVPFLEALTDDVPEYAGSATLNFSAKNLGGDYFVAVPQQSQNIEVSIYDEAAAGLNSATDIETFNSINSVKAAFIELLKLSHKDASNAALVSKATEIFGKFAHGINATVYLYEFFNDMKAAESPEARYKAWEKCYVNSMNYIAGELFAAGGAAAVVAALAPGTFGASIFLGATAGLAGSILYDKVLSDHVKSYLTDNFEEQFSYSYFKSLGLLSIDLHDTSYYKNSNPDVAASGLDPAQHYNLYGWHEGRDPNAFFSTSGYLGVNRDVKEAGFNPLDHYYSYGWKEGRDPSANFDNELYLARNADVKAASMDPLLHFLQYGQAEGRQAYAAVGKATDLAKAPGFDAEYYLLANPDVARAALNAGGDTFEFAHQHYETYGWQYGRNPNAVFDTKGYLAANPDVAAAGMDPLEHYHKYGFSEGRDPSAQFDTKAYLAANPDVKAVGVDPLLHYLQNGALEGRLAFNDGHFG